MENRNRSLTFRIAVSFGVLLALAGPMRCRLVAQAPVPAAAPTAVSERGTVKEISGNTITMVADAGQTVTVNVATGVLADGQASAAVIGPQALFGAHGRERRGLAGFFQRGEQRADGEDGALRLP